MNWVLTEESLGKLLDCFDADHNLAGEKYEDLRRALSRFFEGRGIFFSEECADEVFDRVARRLVEGVEIKNIYSYCYEVARLLLLERIKSHEYKNISLDENHSNRSSIDRSDEQKEKEGKLNCLDRCLLQIPPESRILIMEYYQDDRRDRIKRRQSMADRLGIRRDALANRVQRIRGKLEQCIVKCLKKEAV
jgi:RNA polymerase sigma factor (sigma-70 family)